MIYLSFCCIEFSSIVLLQNVVLDEELEYEDGTIEVEEEMEGEVEEEEEFDE